MGEDWEEWQEDNHDYCHAEEDEEALGAKSCKDFLDELELCEVGILKRMASNNAAPKQLRENLRNLGRTVGNEVCDIDYCPSPPK